MSQQKCQPPHGGPGPSTAVGQVNKLFEKKKSRFFFVFVFGARSWIESDEEDEFFFSQTAEIPDLTATSGLGLVLLVERYFWSIFSFFPLDISSPDGEVGGQGQYCTKVPCTKKASAGKRWESLKGHPDSFCLSISLFLSLWNRGKEGLLLHFSAPSFS